MYIQSIAGKAARLAMILLFVLALAGCGDDGADTGAHMDEHENGEHEHEGEEHAEGFPGRLMVMDAENHELQVFDLESEQVVASFALPQSMAPGFGTLVRATSGGRYGFALQRTGNFSPDNDPDANQIMVIDSGLTIESHGDHSDPVWGTPTLLPYRLGHGGGEMGLYRPIHWSSHHGLTAIFYDGSRHPEDDSLNANGVAVAYKDSDWGSQTLPEPIFELDIGSYAHGGAVAFHDDLFIVSVGMSGEELGGLDYTSTPRGVATYRADAQDWEADIVQDFRGYCPSLHGEAVSGDYVAFGCTEGPGDNPENDPDSKYIGPTITERSGVLVLSYDEMSNSFDAAEVAYPDDGTWTTSGGLRGGTGPSEGIFMATYGEHFLKIHASEVVDGTDAGSELVMVEAGSGGNQGYAFEPVDHNFGGEGRFVVLTRTGNLYIFDVTHTTKAMGGDKLVGSVPGIVGEVSRDYCRSNPCPSLALAPGFAYVSDPANDRVRVVHLEDAEIEDDLPMNAPTSLVVLGWFELEEELEFH